MGNTASFRGAENRCDKVKYYLAEALQDIPKRASYITSASNELKELRKYLQQLLDNNDDIEINKNIRSIQMVIATNFDTNYLNDIIEDTYEFRRITYDCMSNLGDLAEDLANLQKYKDYDSLKHKVSRFFDSFQRYYVAPVRPDITKNKSKKLALEAGKRLQLEYHKAQIKAIKDANSSSSDSD